MSEFNKYSTDGGATFIDVEDKNAVHWVDNDLIGAKNLLPKNKNVDKTVNDVVFTTDEKGIITANGTASDDITYRITSLDTGAIFVFNTLELLQKYGDLYFSGCEGGSGTTYWLQFQENVSYNGLRNYSGDTVISESDPSLTHLNQTLVSIIIKSGTYMNNVKFKPMFRVKSDISNIYEPHAMTNRDITDYILPKDITSDYFGTMPENTSLKAGRIFQIGDLIVGNITINKTDNFATNTDVNIPINSKYSPNNAINSCCNLLAGEWGVPAYLAYLYISSTALIIRNTGGQADMKFAKIDLCYIRKHT